MDSEPKFQKRQKKAKLSYDDAPAPEPIHLTTPDTSKPSPSDTSLFSFKSLPIPPEAGEMPDEEVCPIAEAFKHKSISSKIFSGELSATIYRGQKAYAQYAEKSDSTIRASKFTGSLGPVKAPSHLKATCRFDYSYGLCKDWRISGYCGYGDSCIFVHDRSEFKTGWELEKEWEKEQEEKRKKALENKERVEKEENAEVDEGKEMEKGCEKCGGVKEVFTLCKHEFCFKCSMELFLRSPKCYVCGKDTKGIFNEVKKEVRD
jgi:RING finger protein 113A